MFCTHEKHRGGREGGGEGPGEPGFSSSVPVCAAAEAFGDLAASVTLATIDLIVGAGEVGDG